MVTTLSIKNSVEKFFLLSLGTVLGLVATGTPTASGQADGVGASGAKHGGWSVPFFGSYSRPIVHDGAVIVGSADGGVYAFDAGTGEKIWHYETGKDLRPYAGPGPTIVTCPPDCLPVIPDKTKGTRRIEATPVIRNDTVFIGSHDYQFYALDVKSGELRWTTRLAGEIGSFGDNAHVSDQTIVVLGVVCCPREETLYILDANDGRMIWSTQGQGWPTHPAVSDGVVYFALEDKRFVEAEPGDTKTFWLKAIDQISHDTLWSLEIAGRTPGRPMVSDGVILVGALVRGSSRSRRASMKHVYGVDARSGRLIWDFARPDITTDFRYPLTMGREHVFLVADEGLVAVSVSNGEQAWFVEGNYSEYGVDLSGDLYVQSGSGAKQISLLSIDPGTGRINWQKRIKRHTSFNSVHGDVLYLSRPNHLLAVDASTGRNMWTFRIRGHLSVSFHGNDHITAQATMDEGQIIFPTQFNLFSVDAKSGKLRRK